MTERKGQPFCRLDGEGFRRFIRKFESVMATPFTYSEQEKMSYNAYIDEMVDKLIRAMRLGVPYTGLRIK